MVIPTGDRMRPTPESKSIWMVVDVGRHLDEDTLKEIEARLKQQAHEIVKEIFADKVNAVPTPRAFAYSGIADTKKLQILVRER